MRRSLLVGHANTFHDPAIAVVEGDCVYAEALERHTQCKRANELTRLWYSGRAIEAGMRASGMTWPVREADVGMVSTWELTEGFEHTFKHMGHADHTQEVEQLRAAGGSARWDDLLRNTTEWWRLGLPALLAWNVRTQPLALNQIASIFLGRGGSFILPPPKDLVAASGNTFQTRPLEHHLTHAANAMFTSPFSEAIVAVFDGYGDRAHSSIYHYHDGEFELLHASTGLSLGILYMRMTLLCGFDPTAGEEWKVMGLAAYGKKNDDLYRFLRNIIEVKGLDVIVRGERLDPVKLVELTGGLRTFGDDDVLRAADLAHNFQLAFEDAVIEVCRNAGELGLSKNLCLGGGCALNSSANGKILPKTSFERMHVPSAPADDGNALGAALYEKHCVRKEPRTPAIMSPYLGSPLDEEKVRQLVKYSAVKHSEFSSDEALCDGVAQMLADGNIVGWMQGRAEYGPRALGNRSILGDPRSPGMHERINAHVKFREKYRPLAPSILAEHGPAYFEGYQESPYMDRTLQFRTDVMKKVPAVVHEDGTGRLQSVTASGNRLYHDLISRFYAKTGVPMVLNTSLNVMGKPIVHSPEDAMATFCLSGLDRLVMGRHVFSK